MVLDFNTQVSTAQVLGTGAAVSTSSVPLSVASRVDEIGFNVNVSSVSGTGPTLAIEVIGADDAALSSGVVPLGRVDPVIATGQAAKNYFVKASLFVKKAFLGVRYTMAGTTPAATVTAAVTDMPQGDYQQ